MKCRVIFTMVWLLLVYILFYPSAWFYCTNHYSSWYFWLLPCYKSYRMNLRVEVSLSRLSLLCQLIVDSIDLKSNWLTLWMELLSKFSQLVYFTRPILNKVSLLVQVLQSLWHALVLFYVRVFYFHVIVLGTCKWSWLNVELVKSTFFF